jgi:protein-S-isoprenylcysteine O-methyltransferase Ste14
MPEIRRSIAVSILFLVLGPPGMVLIYLPLWITRFRIPRDGSLWETLLGAALIFAGLAPALESMRRFIYVGRGTLMPAVPTERLVVSGLYRFVRNPMYVGVLVTLAGEAVLFRSLSMTIYIPLVWLGLHLFVLLYEEPTLMSRYPVDYPSYKRHVPRWLPRFTPWQGSEN